MTKEPSMPTVHVSESQVDTSRPEPGAVRGARSDPQCPTQHRTQVSFLVQFFNSKNPL